jgi:hypothetical protein
MTFKFPPIGTVAHPRLAPHSSQTLLLKVDQAQGSITSIVAKRIARHFALGSSGVLIPGLPDLVWVFFQFSPSHRGMRTGLISQIRQQNLPHPSSTYPSRVFPSVWLKRFWKASAARSPSGGNEKLFLTFPRSPHASRTTPCGSFESRQLIVK